jgi:predicted GNAT superfamily acetyltransferase
LADVIIRDATASDAAAILAINAACEPAVSAMSSQDYADIAGWAERVLVAESEDEVRGFLILLRPGTAYPSDNYAWFERRYPRHLYVDRIALSDSARGLGVGRRLYEQAFALAQELGEERVTAEVNADPPNPQSMSFHDALGFTPLAERPSRSGKVVVMFVRELNAP